MGAGDQFAHGETDAALRSLARSVAQLLPSMSLQALVTRLEFQVALKELVQGPARGR
jgi:hypothetical protein